MPIFGRDPGNLIRGAARKRRTGQRRKGGALPRGIAAQVGRGTKGKGTTKRISKKVKTSRKGGPLASLLKKKAPSHAGQAGSSILKGLSTMKPKARGGKKTYPAKRPKNVGPY